MTQHSTAPDPGDDYSSLGYGLAVTGLVAFLPVAIYQFMLLLDTQMRRDSCADQGCADGVTAAGPWCLAIALASLAAGLVVVLLPHRFTRAFLPLAGLQLTLLLTPFVIIGSV
ncbi:hypothetical protein [Streptomyces cinnamoneus]|uniref:Uncharacterized protein n=1 Tax=Streptomyces cinnamoneus TaxID=53446 RepID=A0A918U012_STRCJ|nr:hypothetical protein [Streptomyces cinnamoneus]GHC72857.1 hypothetical protein GCM10010507_60040 [Streptomyces cinnamoneus]